jgi:hypothetical protein
MQAFCEIYFKKVAKPSHLTVGRRLVMLVKQLVYSLRQNIALLRKLVALLR